MSEYTHKPLTRKVFLKRLAQLVGSSTGALSILPLLESNYRPFSAADNADLFTEYITYAGVNGEMKAYVARPKEEKPYPTVVVIHENRGLTAHIEDVARRAAQAGYLAIAPNALAPIGAVANEDNLEMLKMEGGHALAPYVKETARMQVLLYWRKLREIAVKVTSVASLSRAGWWICPSSQ